MQSRLSSLVEACINVLIGYGIALASQLVIFRMYGIHMPLADNIAIGAWFTGISLIRSYLIRRFFNARIRQLAARVGEAA